MHRCSVRVSTVYSQQHWRSRQKVVRGGHPYFGWKLEVVGRQYCSARHLPVFSDFWPFDRMIDDVRTKYFFKNPLHGS